MSSRKKGEVDPVKVLVGIALALIVFFALVFISRKAFLGYMSASTCIGRGGICVDGSICPLGSHEELGLGGCTEGQRCCKSEQGSSSSTSTSTTQLTSKQQTALKNGIIVTLGNSPTPLTQGTTLPLKVGQTYDFKVLVNDELKGITNDDKIGTKCLIYITDSKDKIQRYNLGSSATSAGLVQVDQFDVIQLCNPGSSWDRYYQPSPLDAYKSLTLYAIFLDKTASESSDTNLYSNTQHWAAWKSFPLRVDPVIKITGMSSEWTNKDEITITCNGISCTSMGLKLLRLTEGINYETLLRNCADSASNTFVDRLEYISGTTVQTSGIPLNIDIGGFRLPYQQRVLYVTSTSPIAVVNNKATVTIDKATMIRTFGRGLTSVDESSSPLVGDKTYLCVHAQTSTGGPYHALSDTPLKVDALPPYVDADNGINVIYPDPVTSINAATPYYYRQYPRIQVSGCYDWGQSGCTYYDYYIKTGNFINLNSNTGDWQTGLVGALLTEGVNSLITYFASRDAANTICPLMTSNGYIRNTNPEIRFMNTGQAIVCIRIGDAVGNTRLIWKPIWSPTELFNRILVSTI